MLATDKLRPEVDTSGQRSPNSKATSQVKERVWDEVEVGGRSWRGANDEVLSFPP